MQRILTLLLLAIIFQNAIAQKEFDKWIFGKGTGLDFTSGSPVVMNTTSNGWDNSASIADSAGNLLFASDGAFIYDRNGNVMPNGTGLMGDTSGGATATIVKKPGSNNLYYVFTNPGYYNTPGLRYTVVNMNLNGGLGDVDTANKNVLLFTPYTEKIVPILHENRRDIWILVHEWNSNNYRAYLLTAAGVQNSFVTSSTGTVVSGNADNALGELTVNKAGNMVACAILNAGIIDISNFDNSTGAVSNSITITDIYSVIGLEFSPDGSKLYASHLYAADLTQYDVSTFTQSAISGSAQSVGSIGATYSNYMGGYLMLGPDGKIYVTVTFSHNIGVVDSPNLAGIACQFNASEIDLGQHTVAAGLVDKIVVSSPKQAASVTTVSDNANVSVAAHPNPFSNSTTIALSGVTSTWTFELFDVTGALKSSIKGIEAKNFEFYKNELAAGMYFYHIVIAGKPVFNGKLIIQ